jgi:hypothetical protein
MKRGTIFIVILIIIVYSGCVYQEDERIENLKTEMQPELDSKEFIKLVNAILVEKVSIKDFDYRESGNYILIKNTYDHDRKEIHISIRKYSTRISITIYRGHFRKPNPPLDKIYVKGLLTEEIENQVDLTPPNDFATTQEYYIEVLDYKGILSVSRAKVSVYFGNLGGPDPTPTPPGPPSFISYVIFYGFIGIIIVVCLIITLILFKIKKRREKNE